MNEDAACQITVDHPDFTVWCLTHNRDPEECIRVLEASVKKLEKWKQLAIHYETGHAADQMGCDEECRGFPHPELTVD